ncbi:MAG: nucleoside-diphosphate sugar epimerase, partial [Proteobacteria bacterium]
MSATILLIGASGAVGQNLQQELRGQAIRVTTSKQDKVGKAGLVETVYLNAETGEGLSAAFEGIEKAFLMSPGNIADQFSVFAPQIQEAKRRGLKKVLMLSAFGVDHAVGAPMQRAEVELQNSGLNYVILRPNWFMQNFVNFWGHG